ncbi:MAG: hypothetical protein DWQ04_09270, partial [Chloroflexi bacterium]
YQFLPILQSPDAGSINLNSMSLRILYLLQAATYPLAWVGRELSIERAPVIVWSGTAVIILWTLFSCRQKENRLPLLLGAGWWMAAYALIAIPLTTNYLLHGPRLLYVGSVGVALFWATLLEALLPKKQNISPILQHLGWLGAFLFIVLTSGSFVRDKLQTYQQMTSSVDTIKTTMADFAKDAGILSLNLPEFISPQPTRYPVGVELVSMLGHYLFVEELMDANLNSSQPSAAIMVPEQLAQTSYVYTVHHQQSWDEVDFSLPEQHVFLTTYTDNGVYTSHTGWLSWETAVSSPIADFTEYKLLAAAATTCKHKTTLHITWSPQNKTLAPSTTSFVQLFDATGQLIGQADGPPLAIRPDLIPTDANITITDLRELDTGTQTPALAIIGVYNYLNGERFPATDSLNNPLPDNAWRIQVIPCS